MADQHAPVKLGPCKDFVSSTLPVHAEVVDERTQCACEEQVNEPSGLRPDWHLAYECTMAHHSERKHNGPDCKAGAYESERTQNEQRRIDHPCGVIAA